MQSKYVIILVTASCKAEAEKLSRLIIENKLAACVNVVDSITSLFRWEGKVQQEKEALMIVKAESKFFSFIEKIIKENHSYSVPEIIALPIVHGSESYLNWISESGDTTLNSAL